MVMRMHRFWLAVMVVVPRGLELDPDPVGPALVAVKVRDVFVSRARISVDSDRELRPRAAGRRRRKRRRLSRILVSGVGPNRVVGILRVIRPDPRECDKISGLH